MFGSFPQSAAVNFDLQLAAYVDAIKDFDVDSVTDSIDRIRHGGAGHEGRIHLPSTAELCTEIRQREEIRKMVMAKGLREIGMTGRFVAIEGGKS